MFLVDIFENITNALSSLSLWTVVVKCLGIIIIGFILTKIKAISLETPKVLTKVVLLVCLPCLSFSSFMTDITVDKFQSALSSFIWGFVIYAIMIIITKIIFHKNKSSHKVAWEILLSFSGTTFFGQPLISAVFPEAFNDSNMFNIAHRILLYSYAYIIISGIKVDHDHLKQSIKKVVFNPIIIATFLGFILWSLQLVIKSETPLFYRIDQTVQPLYEMIKLLGTICSPLVWFAIGCTLGGTSFKEAANNHQAWLYSVIKVMVVPLFNLALLFILRLFIEVDFKVVACSVLMLATPPSAIAVSYFINYDKDAVFTSNCSFIATFIAVLCIPLWMIILSIIQTLNVF